MFKISHLDLVSYSEEIFTYEFEYGINYFKGANSTGKTEFYNFIDYMLGSSERFDEKMWFKNTLKEAVIEIVNNEKVYNFKRTYDPDINYFRIDDGEWSNQVNLIEYKARMNSIFTPDEDSLKNLRNFTDEDLTYRTFTIFSFLGEKALGYLIDFFTKGRSLKYSIKLQAILNYIFNNKIEEINNLKNQLFILQQETDSISQLVKRSEFVIAKINDNINKLGIAKIYNGKNKDDIKEEISKIQNMEELAKSQKKQKTLIELEVIYSNISEQIKVHDNRVLDTKKFQIENENRVNYLKILKDLVDEKKEFEYLVNPISILLDELNQSISFNSYIINSNTIRELKKQKDIVKDEIKKIDSKYICFSTSEKMKSIAFIQEMLDVDIKTDIEELLDKQKKIIEIKSQIKILQNMDDKDKIEKLSSYISDLYLSTKDLSEVVNSDATKEGFYIQYYKKGNMLQPMIKNEDIDGEDKKINYYIGSMARHTLIQLCAYLAFIKLLLSENKYPLIPIIVIDHISKPFDHTNRNAIGGILKRYYEDIRKESIQVFMFDDEEADELSINPSHYENLVNKNKTGFNPFYKETNIKGS